jgi:WD40 repeat protein
MDGTGDTETDDFDVDIPDPSHIEECSFFNDPFAPRLVVRYPNSIFPAFQFFPSPKNLSSRARPFLQHVLRANSHITSICRYPFSESFLIGTLDAIHSIANFNKTDVSVLFPPEETAAIELLDIHPSEVFLACNGPSWNVRICSLATGSPVFECNCHRNHLTSLFFAFSFNRICSTSLDGTFVMTDLVKKKRCFCYDMFRDVKPISCAAMRHDETVIAFGFADGTLGMFDHRQDRKDMQTIRAHSSWVNAIDFAVTEPMFGTCGTDRAVKVWDLRNSSKPVFAERLMDYCVRRVLFSNDSMVFGVGGDGCIARWNLQDGAGANHLIVKKCGIVASEMILDSRKLLFSGEDMVLSSLTY